MILLLKSISRLLAALPLKMALAFGRGLGFIFGSVARYHRRDAFDALRRSLPEKSNAEIRGILKAMYANLGMTIVETLRLPYVDDDYLDNCITWQGREYIQTALKQNKGVLVLTAHLGNWEMLSAVAPRVLGVPVSVVAKDIKGRLANVFMEWIRVRFGLRVLPAKNSYRQCLKALKRNELLGFVIDQNMISREGEFVDFFGRPASTTLGLAHLAARTGAPVVPVSPVRETGGRHVFTFLPALRPPDSSQKSDLVAATQRYTNIIEDAIREHPDQWIWIHRRWKTSPDELDRS